MHLSRLAEEIVIWTSPLTGLVKLSDKFTTGSSIMPQKRNPDAAELVRAKTGRIIGALTAMLVVMKGLPLAYAKDMQEDKEGAMDALEALALSIAAMAGIGDRSRARRRAHEEGGRRRLCHRHGPRRLAGAELEDFRSARRITSPAASSPRPRPMACRCIGCPLAAMQEVEPRITDAVFDVLSVGNSVKSRTSFGGHGAEKTCACRPRKWLRKLEKEKS